MSFVKPSIQAFVLLALTLGFATGLVDNAMAGLASSPLGVVANAPPAVLTTITMLR